ncbi:hypothetical protein IMCC3135_32250 [Granulosicoccus antarcticus IMCC3135]|uniref:Uncharacterized protein n=2 Tax=Granulosicoccus TaxID=437504 RepID=A0A2Z2P119_9GAMM|nr:hypothetical protein IMCC3135_32250 [Granulosicoccus antarcticus IMCC3135]
MLLPTLSHALEFQCEFNGDVRQLRVDMPGKTHLCEVTVEYESTGESKVMWHADNDSLFCSAKAYELVGKYENNWNFTCSKWPDRDGIDQLSDTQRGILDLQLKERVATSETALEPVEILSVKTAASTPLDHEPGALAFQYFLSDGSDHTEIIVDNNSSWYVFATIDNLASRITGDSPVDTALISTISDSGALEIVTTMTEEAGARECHGMQVLAVDENAKISARTPHRVICQSNARLDSATSPDQ